MFKLKIMVAKHAGFCSGVKRAIETAEETVANNGKVYVYGQLVHNESVIKDLEKKGVVFVENIEDIPDNAVTVLRAHGEPGTTYEKLKQKNISGEKLKDATCPLVKLVHNAAIKLKKNGYEVIIFGKKNHPEAIGTSYYINGGNTFIVDNPNDAGSVVEHITNFDKAAVISQTTMSVDGYRRLIENINRLSNKKFERLHLNLEDISKPFVFVDTICNPTKQRQSDTEEIAKKSDIMIVIGGKNSSNSKELFAKCKELNVGTFFVQEAEQLEKEWFKNKENVGVTAGASTPDITINDVVEKIKQINFIS
jgi:4-hydroxy-3-methylbut-2-enyl diphosphate reductase